MCVKRNFLSSHKKFSLGGISGLVKKKKDRIHTTIEFNERSKKSFQDVDTIGKVQGLKPEED